MTLSVFMPVILHYFTEFGDIEANYDYVALGYTAILSIFSQ